MSKPLPLTAQLAACQSELTIANIRAADRANERDTMTECLEQERKEHGTTRSALHDTKSAYNFRHNQAMKAENEVHELKHALADANFQYAAYRQEVIRLLLLSQFPNGAQNELMLTRVRNRLLDETCPLPEMGGAPAILDSTRRDAKQTLPPTPDELEREK